MIYIVGLIVLYLVFMKLTEPKVNHIDQTRLNELLKDKKNYRFIDVRTPGEYNSSKIKGFKNIPVQSIQGKLNDFSPNDKVVLLCATGARSMKAARILSKAGIKNLYNVKGGLSRLT